MISDCIITFILYLIYMFAIISIWKLVPFYRNDFQVYLRVKKDFNLELGRIRTEISKMKNISDQVKEDVKLTSFLDKDKDRVNLLRLRSIVKYNFDWSSKYLTEVECLIKDLKKYNLK